MYTLRRVLKDGIVFNSSLGDGYSVITRITEGKFKETSEIVYYGDDLEKVGCFVVGNNGSDIFTVYKYEDTFIMTDSGKTFERLR